MEAEDGSWARVTGTLMSGHRMTSIINSILNAAYTRLAVGEEVYNAMQFEHVGDDIMASTDDEELIGLCVQRMLQSGLKLQASTQSYGEVNAEFLRNCYNNSACIEYVCRTIASLTSGNWANEAPLGTREYAQTMYTSLWNLRNRCLGVDDIGLIATSTCQRRVGLSATVSESFCCQRVAIGSGPYMQGPLPAYRLHSTKWKSCRKRGVRVMWHNVKTNFNI